MAPGGGRKRLQRGSQRRAAARRHPRNDLSNRLPPVVQHGIHQGMSFRRQLEADVPPVCRVLPPLQQACSHQSVTDARGIGGMHTQFSGNSAQVLRPPGVDQNKDPQLRSIHHILDLGNRARHNPQEGIGGKHHRFNFPARRFLD